MHPHSPVGGRHELGQNFLHHRPSIALIVDLVARTRGPILEIGCGDGALTRPLSRLGRDLLAIDIDPQRVAALQRSLPAVTVRQADATAWRYDRPVVVGNVPYHLTTPILRSLLRQRSWRHAVLLTQWEVARKRAHVGGGTMLSAQAAPWFAFSLAGRVPARGFHPMPSVDGGILEVTRRVTPLVPQAQRRQYEHFIARVFTGRGRGMAAITAHAAQVSQPRARKVLAHAGVDAGALPRSLGPQQWARVWEALQE